MFLIQTKGKKRYWTKEYDASGFFVIFSFKSRAGKVYQVSLNKDEVSTITDIGELPNSEPTATPNIM